jgi:Fe-S-cluster-containing dehydrogenase component
MIPRISLLNIDRRRALQLFSAGVAAAMTRCGQPQDEIVPYVDMPEGRFEGETVRYATALPLSGYGRGVLGITVDGRPIKIEGNPRHPYSLGATDIFAEAEVLSLYDPDRSRAPLKNGTVASWQEFATAWARWSQAETTGAGMALVTGRITSPTLLRLISALKTQFPQLRHYRYEPVHDDAARLGARQAFGRVLQPLYRLDEADVILTLDADPLGPGPELLRNAMGFSRRRQSGPPQRIYAAESGWTLTGAMADHRIALPPQRITEIARALVPAVGTNAGHTGLTAVESRFVNAVNSDLRSARGLILAGDTQPPAIHALAHGLNAQLHAPVDLVQSADPEEQDHAASFGTMLQALDSRQIRTLIIFDANPVYDAPDAAQIGLAIAAVPFSVHFGMYRDESAERCQWHLPLSHALESWNDIRSIDGTAALIQPLIRTLYDTRAAPEALNLLAGGPTLSARNLVRASWPEAAAENGDRWWTEALTSGVVQNSASQAISAIPMMSPAATTTQTATNFSLVLSPSSLWNGRYANNAWLQECPAPFTKEVWGNAVHFSPQDAARLGFSHGDAVTLRRGRTEVEAVAAVLPGQASGVARGFLGYGRTRAGTMGSNVGVKLNALGTSGFERQIDGVSVRSNGKTALIHNTQSHTKLEGRDEDLFPVAASSDIARRLSELKPNKGGIVPPMLADQYAWAMVIDNDLCIGCNACIIACQAENNVAVVGPDEIDAGRDMHWLRIDAYELEHADGLRRGFQPIPCMHCETAPCEPVCPVEASVHDHEGLNVQVYNRCIGTRFCEANCPYKVRRFNFFGYTRGQEFGNLGEAPVRAQRNPNVSVRGRGVMEKCTYCVQRISAARRQAEKENRTIREGEVITACAAACPTRAIRFGNRNDNDSAVARLQRHPRHYALLGHLDTRPRTTYLAKIYNPNPALEGTPE